MSNYSYNQDQNDKYNRSYESDSKTKPVDKKYYRTLPELLNVRVGPSMQDSIVCTVKRGVRLVGTDGETGDWRKVRILDGTNRTGFVMTKFLEEG